MRIIESVLVKTAQEREKLLDTWQLLGDPAHTVFMDIETTGFSKTYDSIYLIGIAFYRDGEFRVRQYLASAEADEAKVLKGAMDDLAAFDTVVTYNGDMFDLPFIRERAKRMRVWTDAMQRWDAHTCSVDLLRRYRHYQSFFGWPNLKLKTVEACLGSSRQDPFDGGQLIEIFYEYEKTDDERLEIRSRVEREIGPSVFCGDNGTGMTFELYSPRLSKVTGVSKALERLGIPREDSYAFGDGANDLAMIGYCGCGVAMGNAVDEVKAGADLVCGNIEERGLATVLRELF